MPFSIPNGLGGMDGILRRFNQAKERRELWRSLLQEAYDYAIPQKETFRQYSPGQ